MRRFLLTRRPHAALYFAVLLGAVQLGGCSSPEVRAKGYYDHGMELLAQHDNARASIEFKNAIKAKKDYIPAWLGLAQIQELDRNWAAMAGILRNVVELDPKDLEHRQKLARLLLLGGSTDEALNLINAAYDLDNRNADTLALKAIVLLKLNDSKGAMQAAQAALDLDPKNSGALGVIAADRLASNDTKGALQILDQAGAQTNDLGIDLFKLKIFEKLQDLPQAEALLRKLAADHPTEMEFRKQLARLYIFQKRLDDAEKELRSIVAAQPNNQGAELDLVRLLNGIKGPQAARAELVSRIDAGGDVFPFQIALAEFDFTQGKPDASIALLKSLIDNKDSSPENRLTAQIKLAELYLAKKQTEPAEALISDILAKDSRNTGGLKLRAAIRMDRGQLEPAINDLREALNDQPRSVDLMLLLASAYERSGSIELAEKQFADAVRASNTDANVTLRYVGFLLRHGSAARAEDVLTDLAGRWPQNVEVLTNLAQLKLQRQDWVAAQQLGDAIKRLGNSNAVADQVLAAAFAGQSKFSESVAALQDAVSAAPNAVQPMAALVDAYIRAKQPEKAVSFLQSALKANPENAEAYALLGTIQTGNNQPDLALKNFKTAIEKNPKNVIGYRALANYYVSQRKMDEAQGVVRAGLAQLPDDASLHLMSAEMLQLKGDLDGAIAEYEAMLVKEPGSLIVANNLASLLAEYRTDKASLERAQSLAAMLRKSPIPQFKDTVGWTTYQQGDYNGALRTLEEAAAALPNRAVVHYHLGMAYLATNQSAKATEQFNTALAKAPDPALKAKIEAGLKKANS
jgi:cellulose synthase operon protein C